MVTVLTWLFRLWVSDSGAKKAVVGALNDKGTISSSVGTRHFKSVEWHLHKVIKTEFKCLQCLKSFPPKRLLFQVGSGNGE